MDSRINESIVLFCFVLFCFIEEVMMLFGAWNRNQQQQYESIVLRSGCLFSCGAEQNLQEGIQKSNTTERLVFVDIGFYEQEWFWLWFWWSGVCSSIVVLYNQTIGFIKSTKYVLYEALRYNTVGTKQSFGLIVEIRHLCVGRVQVSYISLCNPCQCLPVAVNRVLCC